MSLRHCYGTKVQLRQRPPIFVGKKVKAILVFPEIIKGGSWSAYSTVMEPSLPMQNDGLRINTGRACPSRTADESRDKPTGPVVVLVSLPGQLPYAYR